MFANYDHIHDCLCPDSRPIHYHGKVLSYLFSFNRNCRHLVL